MDMQHDCTSKGNQAEMCRLFQMTKLDFLFHSQIPSLSGGKFGKEAVKYTTALCFFTRSLFLTINFQGESSWLSSALMKGQLPSQTVLSANLYYKVLLPVWAFANLILAAHVYSAIRCTLTLLGQPCGELPWVKLNSCLLDLGLLHNFLFECTVTHSVLISISQCSDLTGHGNVGIQAGISNDLAGINVRGGRGLKLCGVEGTCCEGDSTHLSKCFVPFIYEDNCLEHHISLPHAKKLCQCSCVYIKSIFSALRQSLCASSHLLLTTIPGKVCV